MYRKEDYQAVLSDIRKTRLMIYIPAALLLAGGVTTFVLRWKWVTIVLLILCGIFFVFTTDVLLKPLKAYRRHMENAMSSDQKEYTGVLKRWGEQAVEREGVMYYPLCLNVGNLEEEEDDRLLYLDANLPKPDWQLGERLYIRSYARYVSSWSRV